MIVDRSVTFPLFVSGVALLLLSASVGPALAHTGWWRTFFVFVAGESFLVAVISLRVALWNYRLRRLVYGPIIPKRKRW
ncbi:hypothetical protein E3E38_06060 [Thermococcus sp. 18S1]|uniref:hypothetical protein n=1 Tax=Thermococcus sp. 18S1 TaxID=1638210 RepID=UPI00143933C7|nr:hypothetical protein [Thermococcus sp. 18S1]NJE30611.1 hypothetical protein [Thermococcus sp. 18S1]